MPRPFHAIAFADEKRLKPHTAKILSVISKMQDGLQGCRMEKLRTSGPEVVRSARFNNGERMIYVYRPFGKNKTCLGVLDYFADHDQYDTSPFLNDPAVRKAVIAKIDDMLLLRVNQLQQNEEKEAADEKEQDQPAIRPILFTPYGRKWIQLSSEQEMAVAAPVFPRWIIAPAGGGKSLVLLESFVAYLDKYVAENPGAPLPELLCFTRTPELLQDLQKRWYARPLPEGYLQAVQFLTPEALLEKHYLPPKSVPTEQETQRYTDWYQQLLAVSSASKKKKRGRAIAAKAATACKGKGYDAAQVYRYLSQAEAPPEDMQDTLNILKAAYRSFLLAEKKKDQAMFGVQWAKKELFLEWCAGHKPKIDLDPGILYEEYKICCGYDEENYIGLGEWQSSFPPEERKAIYALYSAYQTYLEEIGHLDSLLLTTAQLAQLHFPFPCMAVDETQNLSASWYYALTSFYRLPPDAAAAEKKPEVSIFSDSNQGSGSRLFTHLSHAITSLPQHTRIHLSTMHRNPPFMVRCMAKLFECEHDLLGGKADKYATAKILLGENTHTRRPYLVKKGDIPVGHPLFSQKKGPDTIGITTAEYVEQAKSLFNAELVLTPETAEGLECTTAILYFPDVKAALASASCLSSPWGKAFFEQIAARLQETSKAEDEPKKKVHRPKHKQIQADDQKLSEGFHTFYKASTRAMGDTIWVMDSFSRESEQFFSVMGDNFSCGPLPETLEGLTDPGDQAGWIERIKTLVDVGQGAFAYRICCAHVTQDEAKMADLLGAEYVLKGPESGRYVEAKQRVFSPLPPVDTVAATVSDEEEKNKKKGKSTQQTQGSSSSATPPPSVQKAVVQSFPLHDAVRNNHLPSLKKMIGNMPEAERKTCLDGRDMDGNTLIQLAAQRGNAKALAFLLGNKETNVKANKVRVLGLKNKAEKTALMLAVEENKIDAVKALVSISTLGAAGCIEAYEHVSHSLKKGSAIEIYLAKEQKKAQETVCNTKAPTHAAHHKKQVVPPVVKVDAHAVHNKEQEVAPAIEVETLPEWHGCVREGNVEMIKLFLKCGTKVDAVIDNRGFTALHLAAENGHREVVEILLGKKAKVDAKDLSGCTALHQSALHGQPGVAELLLKNKASVHATDKEGYTALHKAALYSNCLDMVTTLLKHNADVDAVSASERSTALHVAALSNHLDVLALLLEHKANVHVVDAQGFTPLHLAAREGYTEIVETLLESKAEVDAKDWDGHTALHLAVQQNCPEAIGILLNYQADVHVVDEQGFTPLHWAARLDHLNAVVRLLAYKADVHAVDKKRRTALHQAAQHNHSDMVALLLENGAGIGIEAKDENERTALQVAAENGHLEVVELLLNGNNPNAHVADVHVVDTQGLTPLHWAAKNGHQEIVELLLQQGANVQAVEKHHGCTALHLAAENGHQKVMEVLLRYQADVHAADKKGGTALHRAAQKYQRRVLTVVKGHDTSRLDVQYGHPGVVALLLEHKADVHAVNEQGLTALHIAARYGCSDVATLLLQHNGTDVHATDKQGYTALYWAVQHNHSCMVAPLLEYKADVHAVNAQGLTALHIAARYGCSDVATLLLQHNGADVHAKDKQGYTALHWAVQHNHSCMVALLSEYKAKAGVHAGHQVDIHVVDEQGFTPLHWAARLGHLNAVVRLLAYKADVHAVDTCQGLTPLHLAAENDHLAVIGALLQHKADIHAVDKKGSTALHLAAENNRWQIIPWLFEKGADAHAVDEQGLTALHIAARYGYLNMVMELLQHEEVDVHAVDKKGSTALHLAAENNHRAIIPWLLKKGADVHAVNKEGFTALQLAEKNNKEESHKESVELLSMQLHMQKTGGSLLNLEGKNVRSNPLLPPPAPPLRLQAIHEVNSGAQGVNESVGARSVCVGNV